MRKCSMKVCLGVGFRLQQRPPEAHEKPIKVQVFSGQEASLLSENANLSHTDGPLKSVKKSDS